MVIFYMVLSYICEALWFVAAIWGLVSMFTLFVPAILETYVYGEQDLKRKYKADWALVTGGSSGIGRAIVEKLATQKLNVVIVALEDKLLKDFHKEISKKHPDLEFRACGANLGRDGYMDDIIASTDDIDVGIVVNNAGFLTTGFFCETDINRLMANFECNATCQIRITHHFANKMRAKQKKGAIMFTSSPVTSTPQPFAAIYGATKAFVTMFGASLGCELRAEGIDCMVMQPSPVSTRLYETAHNLDAINFFRARGVSPAQIASCYFTGIGRTVLRDQGWYAIGTKVFGKMVDFNVLANVIRFILPLMPDYKVAKAKKEKKDS